MRSFQRSKVTHQVVLQGDRVCGHRTCLQVCQYNDSLNIPHSTLTDHYYQLPYLSVCDST